LTSITLLDGRATKFCD